MAIAPISIALRVLPMPPGPVSVTNGQREISSATRLHVRCAAHELRQCPRDVSSSSLDRQRGEVHPGHALSANREELRGLGQPFQAMGSQVDQVDAVVRSEELSGSLATTRSVRHDLRCQRAPLGSPPNRSSSRRALVPLQCAHPSGQRISTLSGQASACSARCASTAARTASLDRWNAAPTPSPPVEKMKPAWAAIADLRISSWRASACLASLQDVRPKAVSTPRRR